MWKELFLACVLMVILVTAAPQGDQDRYDPYEYSYKVEDPEKALFHDKNELGDAQGRVIINQ